jgi:hypothetical protein
MAKASTKKTAGKARSAVTGSFVKPAYAKAHPSTTVIERAKPKAAAKKKSLSKSR